MDDDRKGRQVGSYRLIELIGQGGLGQVWRAEHPVLGVRAAIKIVPAGTADAQERFLREARLATKLRHPGLIERFAFGRTDRDEAFIAMELVEGVSLSRYLEELGLDRTERVLHVFRQLAHALAYVHAKEIIHRDLKPSNVLVTRDHRVKILDFGLSRETRDDDGEEGLLLGTPAYMAPEQFLSSRVNAAVDVFALGMMLAEALIGHTTRLGHTVGDIANTRLGGEERRSTVAAVDRVSPSLARLVERMIATDPSDRPSAAEVASTLDDYRGDAGPDIGFFPAKGGSSGGGGGRVVPQLRLIPVVVALFAGLAFAMISAGVVSGFFPLLVVAAACLAAGALIAAGWMGRHRLGRWKDSIRWRTVAIVGGPVVLIAAAFVASRVWPIGGPAVVIGLGGVAIAGAIVYTRRQRREQARSTELVQRVDAIEVAVQGAGSVTASVAADLNKLSADEKLEALITRTVVAVLEKTRTHDPVGNDLSTAIDRLAKALRGSEGKPPWHKRAGAPIAFFSAVIALGVASVSLLDDLGVWNKNERPTIVGVTVAPPCVRPGGTVVVSAQATDGDGDELAYVFTVTAGTIEMTGPSAAWTLPSLIDARLVAVTVVVSDGRKRATRTMSMPVDAPPRGQIEATSPVPSGGRTRLLARVEDEVPGSLTYQWSTDCGQIVDAFGASATLVAPATACHGSMRVIVRDGCGAVELERPVEVSAP